MSPVDLPSVSHFACREVYCWSAGFGYSSEQASKRSSSQRLQMADAPAAKLKLYSYWRSSCSHRVRIALNLKGLDYEYKAVNLLKGEQSDPEFVKLNPMKFVPALVDGDAVIGESYAIALYLEDKYPELPLLPKDLKIKTLNIQVASIVCSGIQPFHKVSLVRFIEQKVGTGESLLWTQQQIERGFTAIESDKRLRWEVRYRR